MIFIMKRKDGAASKQVLGNLLDEILFISDVT